MDPEPDNPPAPNADAMPCPECCYDLRGQVAAHCPECGLEFRSLEHLAWAAHHGLRFRSEAERSRKTIARRLAVLWFVGLTSELVMGWWEPLRKVAMYVWCTAFLAVSATAVPVLWQAVRWRRDRLVPLAERRKLNRTIAWLALLALPLPIGVTVILCAALW